MTTDSFQRGARSCPACNAPVADNAVLCIACGYHLKLGHHLATDVERASPSAYVPAIPDSNPYASPIPESDQPISSNEPPPADLTDAAARQAAAVVTDGNSVFLVILFAWCLCAPAWLFAFPWYLYSLHCWYSLNARYAELRHPNGFSPHGQLAANFQESRWRLWLGATAGSLFWFLLSIAIIIQVIKRSLLKQ